MVSRFPLNSRNSDVGVSRMVRCISFPSMVPKNDEPS